MHSNFYFIEFLKLIIPTHILFIFFLNSIYFCPYYIFYFILLRVFVYFFKKTCLIPLEQGIAISLYSFSGGSDGKESTCSAGDLGLIPGLGRTPGRGHGNPLQKERESS